jgi:tRNA dimethylallyltransferase
MSSPATIFIVGPTASGKSGLAMELARRYSGEIICADSQTIRKDLDIGTAKPSYADRAKIPHHLLDIIEPYESFSVNQFKRMALKVITDIQSRGKLPIIVGGTGLYVNALFFNFNVDDSQENSEYKKILEKLSVIELQKIIRDKKYRMPSNEQNPRHLIGAILREGRVHENTKPILNSLIYGLNPEESVLKKRIQDRVDNMCREGFVDEVKFIVKKHGQPTQKMDAIGYPIMMDYIDEKISFAEARELFIQGHQQYAKRQKAWFKRNPHIKWFTTDKEALSTITKELGTTLNKSVTIDL